MQIRGHRLKNIFLAIIASGFLATLMVPLLATGTAHASSEATSSNFTKTASLSPLNNMTYFAADAPDADDEEGEEDDNKPADNCENNNDGVLGWIGCAIVEFIDKILTFLDKQIQSLLFIEPDKYASNDLREAWAVLRNIAFFILVPIMTLMVVGTALGFGPFDAYTVKRAMPRLVAAGIFMVLSWPILTFMINLSNVVGVGVFGIMTDPFYSSCTPAQIEANTCTPADSSISAFMSGGDGLKSVGGGILFGGAALFAAINAPVLAFTGLLAAAGLIIGWLVLVLRQVIIITLLVLSPLAILPWIFPGNDRLWKLWRESFVNLLLMFPLIMALIAGGRIFASVLNATDDGGEALNFLLKLFAVIMPYFFIKSTFRLGGAAMAALSGNVNKMGGGILGNIRKQRSAQMAQTMQEAKGFSRFSERNRVSRGINRLTGTVMSGPRGWAPTETGAARRDTNRMLLANQAAKMNPRLEAYGNDDAVQRAMTFDSAKQAQEEWVNAATGAEKDRRQNAVNIASQIGYSRGNSIAAFNRLGQMGYGFDDHDEVQAVANRLSGGNDTMMRRMMEDFEYNSKGAGRFDLSRGKGEQEPPKLQMGISNDGKAINETVEEFNARQAKHDDDWHAENIWKRWNNASLYQHANAKAGNTKAFAKHFEKELQSGDEKRVARALTYFNEVDEISRSGSGANAEILAEVKQRNSPLIEQFSGQTIRAGNDLNASPVIAYAQREGLSKDGVTPIRVQEESLGDYARRRSRRWNPEQQQDVTRRENN